MRVPMLLGVLAMSGALAFGQTRPAPGPEVRMLLTVADHMNHHPADLKPGDVQIEEAAITHWAPYKAGQDLELFVVIDDAANYDFGSKLGELREFVKSQPADVAVGVAYIRNGVLDVAEKPTKDHGVAAAALRAPAGSKVSGPYCALSDLIGNWPGDRRPSMRHEIVLVSSGMDDSAGKGPFCVNAETAIHDAERAGVVLFAVYNPAANYAAESWSKVDSAVVDLAHVSYETGGEAYFVGHGPAASIAPYLADVAEHLEHQYLVTLRFAAGPDIGFAKIHIAPIAPDQELMKPEEVWVGGTGER